MVAPTLTLTNAAATALYYRSSNPAAAAPVLLELNRDADFAADDSLYQAMNAPAGDYDFSVAGLPNSTEWWARLINTSDSTVSPAILAATSAVAPTTAYGGFSIDKAMLVVPHGVFDLRGSVQNPVAGYPITNLLLESPAALTRWPTGQSGIQFQTSGSAVDTVALLGSMMGDDATWNVTAYSDTNRTQAVYSSGWVTFRCSPTLGRRPAYHAFMRLPAPVTARFWEILISSPAPQLIVRHLVVGRARESTNPNRGWGHTINDLGSSGRSRFGDPDRVLGWRGKLVDFEMSWLSEAEYQTKWADLPTRVGKTSPVLVVPNQKRNTWLNDRIGYGPVTDWRGENVQSFKFSSSISVDSLY